MFYDNHYLYCFAPDNECRQRWVQALKEGQYFWTYMAQECGSLSAINCAATSVFRTISPRLMQRQKIIIWQPNITQISGWTVNGGVANRRRSWQQVVMCMIHWVLVRILSSFFCIFNFKTYREMNTFCVKSVSNFFTASKKPLPQLPDPKVDNLLLSILSCAICNVWQVLCFPYSLK